MTELSPFIEPESKHSHGITDNDTDSIARVHPGRAGTGHRNLKLSNEEYCCRVNGSSEAE